MTEGPEPVAGLDERSRSLLVAVLARYPQVSEARLFGSRAMGTHRPESDIDLALFGDVDERLAARIAGELEELPLPYTFDVHAYSTVTHLPLREHIDRVGRRVFTRPAKGA
jgi:predicted nucleotidyltransferase